MPKRQRLVLSIIFIKMGLNKRLISSDAPLQPTALDPFADNSGLMFHRFDTDLCSEGGSQCFGNGSLSSTRTKGTKSIRLSGTDNRFSSPGNFTFSQSVDRSLSLWVRADSDGGGITAHGYASHWRMCLNTSATTGVLGVSHYNGSYHFITAGSSRMSHNTWHHVVLLSEGSGTTGTKNNLTLFLDGSKYTSQSSTNTYGIGGAHTTKNLGRDVNAGYFTGYVDHMRVFNRLLTDAEVNYLRTSDTW